MLFVFGSLVIYLCMLLIDLSIHEISYLLMYVIDLCIYIFMHCVAYVFICLFVCLIVCGAIYWFGYKCIELCMYWLNWFVNNLFIYILNY